MANSDPKNANGDGVGSACDLMEITQPQAPSTSGRGGCAASRTPDGSVVALLVVYISVMLASEYTLYVVLLDAVVMAIAGTGKHDLEHRMPFDGGTEIHVAATVEVFRDESGKPLRMLGTIQEFTERKRVEEALREGESRFRDITSSMADWVWEVDEQGRYTFSSEQGRTLLGRSCENILGKTPFDFMRSDEAARVAAIFADIAAKKSPIKDLENWNVRKDGARICLLTNGAPMLDASPKHPRERTSTTWRTWPAISTRYVRSSRAEMRTPRPKQRRPSPWTHGDATQERPR
jgi:PAS domain S-box-containing protein